MEFETELRRQRRTLKIMKDELIAIKKTIERYERILNEIEKRRSKMEINLDSKKPMEEAETGDIIEFSDGVIGLVLEDDEVALLKYSDGNDWFRLLLKEGHYYGCLEEGNYKILAKANKWQITRL